MKKKNSCTVISCLLSRRTAKLVTVLHLKTKFHCSYILAFFTNFSVVAAMLPIMAKLKVRVSEHLGISELTGKKVKGCDDFAIKELLLFSNHAPGFEDFSILATNNNEFKVVLMESLLINRDLPLLNKNKQSLP